RPRARGGGGGGGGGGPGAGGAGAGGAGAGGAGGAGARGALEDAMASGLERAASAIDSGAAADVLDRWVTATQSISS
ncbi:MAG: anthranilate phosphoribosyltransferase, partial [Actinomycetia bacterium]|nr:anthranilate phosphoribosyltransferase [Actinomycetes bacterium]